MLPKNFNWVKYSFGVEMWGRISVRSLNYPGTSNEINTSSYTLFAPGPILI